MRNKVIFLSTIVLMIIMAATFENFGVHQNRYHQHLEDFSPNLVEESENQDYSTHLPLMDIHTDQPVPQALLKDEDGIALRNDETVSATLKYYDQNTKKNSKEDEPTATERLFFRTRGRSSRSFDKKGYLIKFRKDNLIEAKKIGLSGMVEDSDWALHGPYMDKTLIRNYLCYNLAGEIMDFSPNVRFVELILNDEYQGLYLLTEKIDYNDEGRISVIQTDPDLKSTSYILRLDVGSEDPFYALPTFNYYSGRNGSKNNGSGLLEIVYPSKTLTPDQKDYIENEVSQFEKSLVSYDSADTKWGYPAFIDIDSFVDYFIINEFTMNSDAGRLSTYFYKDIRGKMKVGVWDFNSAFNNYVPDHSLPHYFMMTDKAWYAYLLKDPAFVERIVRRYEELRKTYLSEDYLLHYIDETVAYLGPAIDRNYEKWGYSFFESFDLLSPKERNPRSYEEAIIQLKEIIVERGDYLDENIKTLYALAHDSVNKQFRYGIGE